MQNVGAECWIYCHTLFELSGLYSIQMLDLSQRHADLDGAEDGVVLKMQNRRASLVLAGPMYSNPAVFRPLELESAIAVVARLLGLLRDTIRGLRCIFHKGEFARCAIMAGWLVVLK